MIIYVYFLLKYLWYGLDIFSGTLVLPKKKILSHTSYLSYFVTYNLPSIHTAFDFHFL